MSKLNKFYKTYDYTSRYFNVPIYQDSSTNKYFYGISKNLSDDIPFVYHIVSPGDTLDSLALKYYGRPDLFWVIANANKINDSFSSIYGWDKIKIPTLSLIKYTDGR